MKTCNCNGRGYIIKDKVSIPCECTVKKRNEKIWRDAGIPYVYWNLDIDMIDLRKGTAEDREINRQSITLLKNYKTNFIEMIENNIGLYIKGSHGNGKTMCACDIIKYISLQKKFDNELYKVLFVTFKGIVNVIWGSRSYDPLFKDIQDIDAQKELLFTKWNEADVRIIDDVGKEYITKSGNESSVLDEFVRSNAYAEKKSLILTSNILSQQLAEKYGANVDSILSEKIIHTEIVGENFRKNKVKEIKESLLK